MKTTYTVRQYDVNSSFIDSDGKAHAVEIWDCGHKHRSLKQAIRCLESINGFTRSINAHVVDNRNGERVEWFFDGDKYRDEALHIIL